MRLCSQYHIRNVFSCFWDLSVYMSTFEQIEPVVKVGSHEVKLEWERGQVFDRQVATAIRELVSTVNFEVYKSGLQTNCVIPVTL